MLSNRNISILFTPLEGEAKKLIEADHEIVSAFSGEADQDRYWEIPDSSEIADIELKRKNKGRAKERIEIRLFEKKVS